MRKGTILLVILVVVAVVAVSVGGYFWWSLKSVIPENILTTKNTLLPTSTPSNELTPEEAQKIPPLSNPTANWCSVDADCGLNICACTAMRKENIKNKDLICTRYCPGVPKCISGSCKPIQK